MLDFWIDKLFTRPVIWYLKWAFGDDCLNDPEGRDEHCMGCKAAAVIETLKL